MKLNRGGVKLVVITWGGIVAYVGTLRLIEFIFGVNTVYVPLVLLAVATTCLIYQAGCFISKK